MAENVKVFISYSWSSAKHIEWVTGLAERLVSDGINVILDKWDLKEGHDKYAFMESMARSKEVSKVLMILDKAYCEKANKRTGGVGSETQIISPEVYSDLSQEKFIPIVTERDENGMEYAPTFLKSRIYIDLSSEDHFENEYEKLLRNIYQRPASIKPALGKAPAHLFEEGLSTHRTSSIVRSFQTQIDKNPKIANSIIRDFFSEFYESIKKYSIIFSSNDPNQIGKDIIDNLNKYTSLRTDFINFINLITKESVDFDVDILIKFLEKLPALKYPQNERGSFYNYEFDNFRFMGHELFLYLITISLKNENYKVLEELFYSLYFIDSKYERSTEPKHYDCFYCLITSFDSYYRTSLSFEYISPMADFVIKRIPDSLDKNALVEADMLCYYVASLNNLSWFPITYIFNINQKFDTIRRMTSLRHFEKVKKLFKVDTAEEFKTLLYKLKETGKSKYLVGYSNTFERVFPLYSVIDIDRIGVSR